MLESDEVGAMLRLHRLGWGTKRIAAELGCSRTTVKRYIEAGGWTGYRRPRRGHKLDGLEAWLREVADLRIHGTTGEPPIERFRRDEAARLRPLDGRPPFRQVRELVRKVQPDCSVEIDTNAYSVPWRLIGESVTVMVAEGRIRIHHAGRLVADHAGRLVADHAESTGRKGRIVETAHFHGVAGHAGAVRRPVPPVEPPPMDSSPVPELLRPLAEYEQIVGGGW